MEYKRLAAAFTLSFLLLVGFASAANLEIAEFYPTDDSWVEILNPLENHGISETLEVKNSIGGDIEGIDIRKSLVRFDISSLPENATINSAFLRLFADQSDGEMIDIRLLEDSWDEENVNWDNLPAFSDIVESGKISGEMIELDVLDEIRDIYNELREDHGFLIELQGDGDAVFFSKEFSDEEFHPVLVISYEPPRSYDILHVIINEPTGTKESVNINLDFSIISFSIPMYYNCTYHVTQDSEVVVNETEIKDCEYHNAASFDVPGNGNYVVHVNVESGKFTGHGSSAFSVSIPNNNGGGNNNDDDDNGGGSTVRRSGGSCITEYVYTEWSSCRDGFQIRAGYLEDSRCVSLDPRAELVRECDFIEESLSSENEEDVPFLSRLTGAVIGSNGRPTAAGIFAFFVLLAIAYFVVAGMRASGAESASNGKKSNGKAKAKKSKKP